MFRLICFLALSTFAYADVGGSKSGANQYLPPEKGYAYDKPNQAFENVQKPQQVPFPRPPGGGQAPSRPQGPPAPQRPNQPPADDHVHEPGMPFDFQYNVNDIETQNDYSHKAVSDGDVTRGEYRVQMPDGRTQVVKYTADWKNGYNAEVSYEGEAKFPDQPIGAASGNGGYKY